MGFFLLRKLGNEKYGEIFYCVNIRSVWEAG